MEGDGRGDRGRCPFSAHIEPPAGHRCRALAARLDVMLASYRDRLRGASDGEARARRSQRTECCVSIADASHELRHALTSVCAALPRRLLKG